jgi:hypothetical protein
MSETIFDGPPSSADLERSLVEVAEERDRFKKERDELLLGVAEALDEDSRLQELLEAIDAHRKEKAHGRTANMDLADDRLYELADRIHQLQANEEKGERDVR